MSEIIPYQDIEKMGTAVATSGLFGLKTKEQAIALMLVAQALGKHPALAAMEYNIIQGRPAKKAEAIQADFQAAGGKIEWHELNDTKAEATFSHPQGGSLKLDWTIDRAKKANLYDKDGSMYKKYPRQMLKARLVADGVRAVYPAAMGGVRAVEEMDDATDDVPIQSGKSRVESLVDHQSSQLKEGIEEAVTSPVKEKKDDGKADVKTSKDVGKTGGDKTKKTNKKDEGTPTVQGVLENVRTGQVEGQTKYLFKIKDKEYGTFDTELIPKIMEVIDGQQSHPENKYLVEFSYSERPSTKTAGKIFYDIKSFKLVTTEDVEIPE